jgi:putative membrane protein
VGPTGRDPQGARRALRIRTLDEPGAGRHVGAIGRRPADRPPPPETSVRNFVIRLFVNALALSAAAYLVEGITLTGGFGAVLVVALIFGLINAILKPVVLLLSLPFLFLTLGLFALVINAGMLLLTDRLTGALSVDGFWAALWGSVMVSLVSLVLNAMLEDKKD